MSNLPRRVEVLEVVSSRYGDSNTLLQLESDKWFCASTRKPLSWDQRRAGIDIVKALDGKEYKLFSDGGQSVPGQGWTLLITEEHSPETFLWTLYGLKKAA